MLLSWAPDLYVLPPPGLFHLSTSNPPKHSQPPWMDLVFRGLPSQKPECHPGVLCFLDSTPPNQPEPITCAAPPLPLLCHLSTPALISPFPLLPLPPHPHRAATVIFLEHQTHLVSSQLKTPQRPSIHTAAQWSLPRYSFLSPSHWITRALQNCATAGTSGSPLTSSSGEYPQLFSDSNEKSLPSSWGYIWSPLQVELKAKTIPEASLSCTEFEHFFCDIFTPVIYRSLLP